MLGGSKQMETNNRWFSGRFSKTYYLYRHLNIPSGRGYEIPGIKLEAQGWYYLKWSNEIK